MKHHHTPRGGRLITGLLAGLCSISSTFAATQIPTGKLNVDRSLVRVGSRSQLDWNIQYSSAVTEVANVTPTGTIIPKTSLRMRVRTLGVAFQSGSTRLPIDGKWSKNNGTYSRFFYGTGPSVVPTNVLIDTTVTAGDKIDFGARGWNGSSWLPFHDTRTSDKYVVVLKNGDSAPAYAPAYNQQSAKGFLAPYIDSTGKVSIGNRDLIVLWECSTAAPGTTYFDMQDLVILVTFE